MNSCAMQLKRMNNFLKISAMKPRNSYIGDANVTTVSTLTKAIRIPLANITLSAEMLESASKNEDTRLYLSIIVRNATRIDNLVNKVAKLQSERNNN